MRCPAPNGSFNLVRITTLKMQNIVPENQRKRFRSLSLESFFHCRILDEGQRLLGEVVPLHIDPMRLKLVKHRSKCDQIGINLRAAHPCRTAHRWIVNLNRFHPQHLQINLHPHRRSHITRSPFEPANIQTPQVNRISRATRMLKPTLTRRGKTASVSQNQNGNCPRSL